MCVFREPYVYLNTRLIKKKTPQLSHKYLIVYFRVLSDSAELMTSFGPYCRKKRHIFMALFCFHFLETFYAVSSP